MFNIGFSELLILGVIALIFIGPQQLPEVARTIGRLLNEWKRATSDLQSSLTSTITEDINLKRENPRLGDPAMSVETLKTPGSTAPDAPELPVGAEPVAGAGYHGDGNKS